MGRDESTCGKGYECDLDTGDVQGVCPDGWHLPSMAEWESLVTAVGDHGTAGQKLKGSTLWKAEDGVTNEDAYGFSAFPAGYRGNEFFDDEGTDAYFWSATESNSNSAYYMALYYEYESAHVNYLSKHYAYSVRCLENSN